MGSLASYQFVLFALTLWREARGRTHDEKVAIAHVIANRMTHVGGEFPKTLVGVLTQPMQFTSIRPPWSNTTTLAEWQNATTWPSDNDALFAECCSIVDQFGSGEEPADPTSGATNYYSDPISAVPSWAAPDKATAHIGVFHFFNL